MLKVSRLLHPRHIRNQLLHKKLPGEDVKGSIWQNAINTFAAFSTVRQDVVADAGKREGRVFAPYSVFKGKAALSAEPRLPTFNRLDSGGVKLNRRGVIMLTFWPSVGERKYDWEKRQLFALSATEVGSLISMGTRDSSEFFHDPSMLSSNAGQVRKSLSIKPNADGSGYFISLSVVNNNLKTNDRFTVPVTTAEFAVMRTAFSFALPHIMGWDRFTNRPSESISQSPSKVVPQLMEAEWDR
ncbi:single-stranded DNA-binding protein WHY2, mitochondrial isoform X1 [Solanum pennellii]|uniref:Single-stranded DNA-binding protein WHY2, mitochondrial isoform X1 n=1 Tax=Solanum pennellii TaxID=28526 RepID=A0ABM1FH51_SOLPN|nr:single-stranded DNA-binding protein WHY2, mitochondrial isoform X1 [Solanum pennellii]